MLSKELSKYINHKVRLASCSAYYRAPELREALEWAYWMQQQLKYHLNYYNDRTIAQEVIKAEQKLYKIIPCDRNKSYKSSLENYHKIINRCKDILQPKQNII